MHSYFRKLRFRFVSKNGTAEPPFFGSQDLRPLKAFQTDYPECEALLLHRGPERLLIDGVWCLPVDEFLRNLTPGQDLTHYLR
jgi:hypothetical protein